jgi:predicted MPP superfamily phosphohydrolase
LRSAAQHNPPQTLAPGAPTTGVRRAGAASRIAHFRPRRGPWIHFRHVAGWEWNRVELTLPTLPAALDGVRIVHISDLHLRQRWPRQLDEVIERVNVNPPDLILFTGDFVDDKHDYRPALPHVQRLIASLRSRHGMFAIVGNHDTDLLAPHLVRFGLPVIVHQRIEVPVRGDGDGEAGENDAGTIELIGLPGPERGDLDEHFLRALPPKRPGVPRIVLSHYPDLLRPTLRAGVAPDLYLAGHTHGGQICLPGERAILRHDSLPRHLCKGAHDYHGSCLIVSRGFGFTTLPLRVFCPAEVVEIVLKQTQDTE